LAKLIFAELSGEAVHNGISRYFEACFSSFHDANAELERFIEVFFPFLWFLKKIDFIYIGSNFIA